MELVDHLEGKYRERKGIVPLIACCCLSVAFCLGVLLCWGGGRLMEWKKPRTVFWTC